MEQDLNKVGPLIRAIYNALNTCASEYNNALTSFNNQLIHEWADNNTLTFGADLNDILSKANKAINSNFVTNKQVIVSVMQDMVMTGGWGKEKLNEFYTDDTTQPIVIKSDYTYSEWLDGKTGHTGVRNPATCETDLSKLVGAAYKKINAASTNLKSTIQKEVNCAWSNAGLQTSFTNLSNAIISIVEKTANAIKLFAEKIVKTVKDKYQTTTDTDKSSVDNIKEEDSSADAS